jgi:hypothetical protein
LSSQLLYCWSASPIPTTTFQEQVSNSSISKPAKYVQISTPHIAMNSVTYPQIWKTKLFNVARALITFASTSRELMHLNIISYA